MVRGADDNITTIAFTEFSVAASSIDIIQELTQVLTPEQVMLDPSSLETYGQDWTRFTSPAPSAVVFPHDTADVVAIVECARRCKFALVPSGGRTGLSGGACGDERSRARAAGRRPGCAVRTSPSSGAEPSAASSARLLACAVEPLPEEGAMRTDRVFWR